MRNLSTSWGEELSCLSRVSVWAFSGCRHPGGRLCRRQFGTSGSIVWTCIHCQHLHPGRKLCHSREAGMLVPVTRALSPRTLTEDLFHSVHLLDASSAPQRGMRVFCVYGFHYPVPSYGSYMETISLPAGHVESKKSALYVFK